VKLAAAAPALLIAFALGCRPSTDQARATVDAVASAARDRSADHVLENLTATFRAEDGSSVPDVDAMLRRYFAAYESLAVELSDVSIERSEGAALARFTAKVSGSPRAIGGLAGLLPSSSSWRFEARLVPDGGRWKIAWASWKQAT